MNSVPPAFKPRVFLLENTLVGLFLFCIHQTQPHQRRKKQNVRKRFTAYALFLFTTETFLTAVSKLRYRECRFAALALLVSFQLGHFSIEEKWLSQPYTWHINHFTMKCVVFY